MLRTTIISKKLILRIIINLTLLNWFGLTTSDCVVFTFSGLGIYQLHVKVKNGNVGYIQFTHWPPQVNLVAPLSSFNNSSILDRNEKLSQSLFLMFWFSEQLFSEA